MQLQLSIPIAADRHLVPVQTAMCSLGLHEDAVLYAVESGELSHAWNIGCIGVRRRQVRIWKISLTDYITGNKTVVSDEDVIESIFPEHRDDFRSTEVAQKWVCSSTHIHDLIRGGELEATSPATCGVNGFARISRTSLVHFLNTHRIA